MIVSSQYSGPSDFRQAILRKDSKAALRFSEGDFSVIEGENSNLNSAIFRQLDPALIRKMIDKSNVETLNFIDHVGWSAIHWAAFRANTEVVRWLCEAKADVNRPDNFGVGALEKVVLVVEDEAAQGGQLKTLRPQILATVQTLIEYGAWSDDSNEYWQSELLEQYLSCAKRKYREPDAELITILVAAYFPPPTRELTQTPGGYSAKQVHDIHAAIQKGLNIILRRTREAATRALYPTLPMPLVEIVGDYVHQEPEEKPLPFVTLLPSTVDADAVD